MKSIRPSLLVIPLALLSGAQAADTLVPTSHLSLSDPGLEVTIWATSPMLKNPTNMDFDQDGRIWVAEGVNYRGHSKRQPGGDRILVLEDTDGDGKADKSDVFVQDPDLLAPMGIAVIDNRIVVSMAPNILIYTDVNRDRRFDPAIDKREVLLTGFNGRIHDHSVHSITVGPDGQWYWNAGNCGAMFTDKSGKTFRIGSAYDPTYRGGQGDLGWRPPEIAGQASDDGHVWVGGFAARMNPDGSGVTIIGHNFRNSYEQTVTSFGDVFQNDNDDPPACRTSFLLEYGNAGFCSFDGKRAWQADRRPGQTIATSEWRQDDPGTMPSGDVYGGGSPTGIVFVEDSALGNKYRGLLLSCEPGRNVVFGYLPQPDKAGFKLERFDFLTSNREGEFAGTDFKGGNNQTRELKTLFRPSDVGVGADGAIYVTDWFDARVGGHADWDESLSGTIYRIAPKGFKPKVPKLNLSTVEGAIAALKSPTVNVRGAAQSALLSQGNAKASLKAVSKLLSDSNPYVQARAIWLLSRLGSDGLKQVEAQLKSRDAQTRVVDFRALRRQNHRLLETARTLATDPSPAVRREVALAMRDLSVEQSRDILITLAKGFDGSDRTYLEAWGTGAKGKEAEIYESLKSAMVKSADPLQWTPQFAQLAWRLHPPKSVPDFRTRALASTLSVRDRKAALTVLGYNPSNAAAQAMLEAVKAQDKDVKAEAFWWLLNRKESQWKSADIDSELKRSGLYDPDTIELLPTTIPEAEPPKYGAADVLKLQGDLQRGFQKFQGTCTSCHRIGDEGTDYAPNLSGWGQRQTTEVLIQSIIHPSADIAHGFSGVEVLTKDGTEIHGLIVSDGDPVVVQSASGLLQMVPKARIKSRQPLQRSLMMSADQLGLSPQDLADVAAFMKTK